MKPEIDETLLTAYALGEVNARERGRVAAHVDADADARRYVEEVRATAGMITDQLAAEHGDGLTVRQHESIERRLRQFEGAAAAAVPLRLVQPGRAMRLRQWLPLAASLAASIAIVCGSLAVLLPWMYPRLTLSSGEGGDGGDASSQVVRPGEGEMPLRRLPGRSSDGAYARDGGATNALPPRPDFHPPDAGGDVARDDWEAFDGMQDPASLLSHDPLAVREPAPVEPAPVTPAVTPLPTPNRQVAAGPPVTSGDAEDVRNDRGKPGNAGDPRGTIAVSPPRDADLLQEVLRNGATQPDGPKVFENPFRLATQRPRSAFPVRVETGSYKVVRRHLLERELPPAHLVRIEELVNRFRYDYAPPADPDAAVVASVEIATCPWDASHRLARVAVKAREGGATVVARGVEVAVEFNPIAASAWRLIGYENAPAAQTQPAGLAADLAAAGTATAFYEIVPAAGDLRVATRGELFTLAVRYRDPGDGTPHTFQLTATDDGQGFDRATPDFRFASAVAAFGMLLRDSQFRGAATYGDVIRWAHTVRSGEEPLERAAFIELARAARDLANKRANGQG